jgi:hypothetical protein
MRLTQEKKEEIARRASYIIIDGIKSVIEFRKTHPNVGYPRKPFFNAFELNEDGILLSKRSQRFQDTIFHAFGITIGKSFGIDEMPELSDGQIKDISRLVAFECSQRWRSLHRTETEWCIDAQILWIENGVVDMDIETATFVPLV